MSDLPDPLREFERRMQATAQAGPAASAELLLDVMEPAAARLFRLGVIPHQFDVDILQMLAPEHSHAEIQQRCEEFGQLSFVTASVEGWSVHEAVRRHFFSQWFKPQVREEFATASARLAEYFQRQAELARGDLAETARRRRMFHLIGADQEAGFQEFEQLLRRARHNRVYSECSQLLRLLHEYDGFLATRYRLWLEYHEAKLAADLRNMEQAEAAFLRIQQDPDASPELRSAAYVRLGYVHGDRRNWDDAISCYERALALAETSEAAHHSLPRILHDLGAAYREKGDLERAESLLERSVQMAQEQQNLSAQALAYNSRGVLALKRRDVRAAIDAFERSLDALQRNDELFRTAQIYNNLGLAYSDLPDWERSAEYFRKSLDIKARAGDTLGQASALNNLARVQASEGNLQAAIDSSTQAIALFTDMRDMYDAALAKHNRGKLFHRMRDTERARQDLAEAAESFSALGKSAEAAEAAQDLEGLSAEVGLPWWVWAAVVLFVLMVFFVVLAELTAD
jgi:tetratricopeptide (TPR) repeat protein